MHCMNCWGRFGIALPITRISRRFGAAFKAVFVGHGWTRIHTDGLLERPNNEGDKLQFPGTISKLLQAQSSVCIRVHPWLIPLPFHLRVSAFICG